MHISPSFSDAINLPQSVSQISSPALSNLQGAALSVVTLYQPIIQKLQLLQQTVNLPIYLVFRHSLWSGGQLGFHTLKDMGNNRDSPPIT